MKMSKLYAPTLKEDPTEAELASHRLLLRAGMIRRGAAGLYSYLPLAWRSIRKIEDIIRDEMEAIDAQEMLAPILTDAALWHQSGRWDAYGPELMRITDRHDHEFALGPTHEETFTDLVRNELRSYKQLPVTLYHIQDKFRDELRPRFGLMRGREFIMKDAYSFSATQESLQECYDQEKEAYARICERVGLRALPVVADSGQIGGDTSVEFMAIADAGEAELVYCDECGFAADTEAASAATNLVEGAEGELERVETPGCATIEEVSRFLSIPEAATRKALALVDGDGEPVVVFVPGDHEMNDVKAEHAFGAYHLMSDEELEQYGLVKGYIGPVGLPEGIRACADVSLRDARWWTIGANEADAHLVHACQGRDFSFADDAWVDVICAKAGDVCPKCSSLAPSTRRPWAPLSPTRTAGRSLSSWAATALASRVPCRPSSSSTTTSTASSGPSPSLPTRWRSCRSTCTTTFAGPLPSRSPQSFSRPESRSWWTTARSVPASSSRTPTSWASRIRSYAARRPSKTATLKSRTAPRESAARLPSPTLRLSSLRRSVPLVDSRVKLKVFLAAPHVSP